MILMPVAACEHSGLVKECAVILMPVAACEHSGLVKEYAVILMPVAATFPVLCISQLQNLVKLMCPRYPFF